MGQIDEHLYEIQDRLTELGYDFSIEQAADFAEFLMEQVGFNSRIVAEDITEADVKDFLDRPEDKKDWDDPIGERDF